MPLSGVAYGLVAGDWKRTAPIVPRAFYDRWELTLRMRDVRRFWTDVVSGRFDAAATTYAAQPDWERRAHLLSLARELPVDSSAVEHWIAQQPGHPLPLTVKGLHAVGQAWHARSAAPAEHLPVERLEAFHRHLRVAEEFLTAAAKADSSSPVPWMGLLDSGMGLQISLREYEYRMEQMATRFPLYSGFSSYLQFVSDRWFGSHEQMWEFADSVNEAASVGSPLHAVQAEASIERFLSRGNMIVPRRALVAEGRLDPLLRAADRSVLHSSFDPDSPAGVRALSSFVVAFERYGCRRLNHHLIPLLRRHWMADHPARYFRGRFGPTVMWRGLSGRYRAAALLPFRRRGSVAPTPRVRKFA